jgi:hypothetical protein
LKKKKQDLMTLFLHRHTSASLSVYKLDIVKQSEIAKEYKVASADIPVCIMLKNNQEIARYPEKQELFAGKQWEKVTDRDINLQFKIF